MTNRILVMLLALLAQASICRASFEDCRRLTEGAPPSSQALSIGFPEGIEPLFDQPIRSLSGSRDLQSRLRAIPFLAEWLQISHQKIKLILPHTQGGIENFFEDLNADIFPALFDGDPFASVDEARVSYYSFAVKSGDLAEEVDFGSYLSVSSDEMLAQQPAGPVVVWTDFGLLERREKRWAQLFWKALFQDLERAGHPYVVITPIPGPLIPPDLGVTAPILSLETAKTNPLGFIGADLAKARAGSVRKLAMLSSLAGRIEPQLLRELRMRFLPDGLAVDEVLLRDGHWVHTNSATGLVLSSEVRTAFREELARDLRLDSVWSMIFELRTGTPWHERETVKHTTWLLMFEELSYWGLKGLPQNEADRQRLNQIFELILKALDPKKGKRADAQAWLRAEVGGKGLPQIIRDLPQWKALEVAN